jgi:hypothetical protein
VTASRFLPLFALSLVVGCVETELDSVEGEIDGDRSWASDYFTARAVNMSGCTGTIIGPRHVLTALHCNPNVQPRVEVYLAGHPEAADDTNPFNVVAWHSPWGTGYSYNPAVGLDEYDQYDSNGDIADMMILEVDRNFSRLILGKPPAHPPAILAWTYPGSGVWGTRVGAGNHDGNSNPDGILFQNDDTTYSGDDDGAWFILDDNHIDPGDSGSPFYVNQRVVGTLKGNWGFQSRYMSVPARLPWILGIIQYRWPGQQPFTGKLTGTVTQVFTNAENACQYACDKTAGCQGYNWAQTTKQCSLLSSISGTLASSIYHSARRF